MEFKNNKILVVDDEPSIREILKSVLSASGYSVTLSHSAEDAYSKFSKDEFDLILSDNNMPGDTGLQLIRAIKYINQDAKTILMTGGDISLLADEMRHVKVCGFVQKPFEIDEVVGMINEVLN
ncbi:MAG: hypothetical protein A2231_01720 [Candidatus Firestonebacteria bacterium RIFOXYA2_FULL_40_8]|nr:MAG: hypothetical protein A2231_01720 [Candidatus Firestonebacteria bacterium RIFOXYA2_FULL_40_8]